MTVSIYGLGKTDMCIFSFNDCNDCNDCMVAAGSYGWIPGFLNLFLVCCGLREDLVD